jgi:uncharacterized protein YigE (DUF2233 family)
MWAISEINATEGSFVATRQKPPLVLNANLKPTINAFSVARRNTVGVAVSRFFVVGTSNEEDINQFLYVVNLEMQAAAETDALVLDGIVVGIQRGLGVTAVCVQSSRDGLVTQDTYVVPYE